jgi:hypothetical protein
VPIQSGQREVLGQYVEIADELLPVTITYRPDGWTVRGTVEECGYPEFIRRVACRQNGRFEITGIRPGEYYAFAFDREPGMLEADARTRLHWLHSK